MPKSCHHETHVEIVSLDSSPRLRTMKESSSTKTFSFSCCFSSTFSPHFEQVGPLAAAGWCRQCEIKEQSKLPPNENHCSWSSESAAFRLGLESITLWWGLRNARRSFVYQRRYLGTYNTHTVAKYCLAQGLLRCPLELNNGNNSAASQCLWVRDFFN